MSKDATKCPKCGSTDTGDHWAKGRRLQFICYDCGWKDKPRTPKKQKIERTKTIFVSEWGGFNYTIFDKYGHTLTISRSYHSEAEAIAALKNDLESDNKNEDVGPCTAVLWPQWVKVTGKKFK